MRLSVHHGDQRCEIDVAIDYRALPSVHTRYGPALDLRELGANKVLAVFDRAAARDFVDLAEIAGQFPFEELVDLAMVKDRGLTRLLLSRALGQGARFNAKQFGLDREAHTELLTTIERWQRLLLAR